MKNTLSQNHQEQVLKPVSGYVMLALEALFIIATLVTKPAPRDPKTTSGGG